MLVGDVTLSRNRIGSISALLPVKNREARTCRRRTWRTHSRTDAPRTWTDATWEVKVGLIPLSGRSQFVSFCSHVLFFVRIRKALSWICWHSSDDVTTCKKKKKNHRDASSWTWLTAFKYATKRFTCVLYCRIYYQSKVVLFIYVIWSLYSESVWI